MILDFCASHRFVSAANLLITSVPLSTVAKAYGLVTQHTSRTFVYSPVRPISHNYGHSDQSDHRVIVRRFGRPESYES